MRGQPGSGRFEPFTQGRLEMPGDGDDHWRRVELGEIFDERLLLGRPERALQDDDVVRTPWAATRLIGADRLERYL